MTETVRQGPGAGDLVPIGDVIAATAAERPHECAVTVRGLRDADRAALTWRELVTRVHQQAAAYRRRGLRPGDITTVALPPGLCHVVATLALWEAGAAVVPVDHRWPHAVKQDVVGRYPRGWIVEDGNLQLDSARDGGIADTRVATALADGLPRSVSMSGGTTGIQKLVVRNRPWAYQAGRALSARERDRGVAYGQTQIVGLPLYHAGFGALYHGLALGHRIVIPRHGSPALFLQLLRSERAEVCRTVPAQMRILMETCGRDSSWFSSAKVFTHTAARCPDPVKHRWLELLGPTHVYEEYGTAERIGVISIRGDEWLVHRGSIGRAVSCSVRICDGGGKIVSVGETGELYMCDEYARQPVYIGPGPSLAEIDGHFSVGDLAFMDADGYITLIGRKDDTINVGGVKVYPRDIERVIERNGSVCDVRVYGAPDAYLGEVVHATVSLRDGDRDEIIVDLRRRCGAELSRVQVPRSIEVVADLRRTASGKLPRANRGNE